MKPNMTVHLANPRGFCAGVDRAIKIVEKAIEKYGPPVYVRHEIVHNKYVVKSLEEKGAIFVEELDEVPDNVPVIFSAHGVPKSVPQEAKNRKLEYVDATCPLVSKVHREAEMMFEKEYDIILIGHEGHPEVIGTMGQLPEGAITLVEDVKDVDKLNPKKPDRLAVITQTTLSVDDTKDVLAALKQKFPDLHEPKKEDICYATTNRQAAVKEIAAKVQAMIVLGAPNSSNSKRLVEVALKYGCEKASLVQRAQDMDMSWFDGIIHLGITAGASAPEILVQEVIDRLKEKYNVTLVNEIVVEENVTFNIPRSLLVA